MISDQDGSELYIVYENKEAPEKTQKDKFTKLLHQYVIRKTAAGKQVPPMILPRSSNPEYNIIVNNNAKQAAALETVRSLSGNLWSLTTEPPV